MLPWRQKDKFAGFALWLNYGTMAMAVLVSLANKNQFLLRVYLAVIALWLPVTMISWFRFRREDKKVKRQIKIHTDFDPLTQNISELPPEEQEEMKIIRAQRILKGSRDEA